jgi:hypothetical protein
MAHLYLQQQYFQRNDRMNKLSRRYCSVLFAGTIAAHALAQEIPADLGAMPDPARFPTVEFVFEEHVTLAPATVLGETALGHRQYIPITGGTIAGPKLQGRVIPGGWDFQLRYPGGCGTLTADYFLEASDGTVIHILNEMFRCDTAEPNGERSYSRPRFEAPAGPHEWLTRGTFVGTIQVEPPSPGTAAETDEPELRAIRIKVYQIK